MLAWGLAPGIVTADSGYSGVANLKFLKKKDPGFLIALEKNCVGSERAHEDVAVESLDLPLPNREDRALTA